MAEPERAALFLDVDGVLAPIVERPGRCSRTGRDASGAAQTGGPLRARRLRDGPAERAHARSWASTELVYAGEHGLELDPEAAAWAARIHAFAAGAGRPRPSESRCRSRSTTGAPPTRPPRRSKLDEVERAAAAAGFRTRWGRMVLEVLPPVDASKGTAVRHLLADARPAIARSTPATTRPTSTASPRSTDWRWRCASPSPRAKGRRELARARRHRRLPSTGAVARASAGAVAQTPSSSRSCRDLPAGDVELGLLASCELQAHVVGPGPPDRDDLARGSRDASGGRGRSGPAGSCRSSSASDAVQRYERS